MWKCHEYAFNCSDFCIRFITNNRRCVKKSFIPKVKNDWLTFSHNFKRRFKQSTTFSKAEIIESFHLLSHRPENKSIISLSRGWKRFSAQIRNFVYYFECWNVFEFESSLSKETASQIGKWLSCGLQWKKRSLWLLQLQGAGSRSLCCLYCSPFFTRKGFPKMTQHHLGKEEETWRWPKLRIMNFVSLENKQAKRVRRAASVR